MPFTQVWPDGQHTLPHTCVDGQQSPFKQVSPDWQHALPHSSCPVGQTTGAGPHVWSLPVPWHVVTPSAQHVPRHFIRGDGHGLAAKATPGMEASEPPTRAAPINLSALRRDMVPLASPLASSSMALALVSCVIVLCVIVLTSFLCCSQRAGLSSRRVVIATTVTSVGYKTHPRNE